MAAPTAMATSRQKINRSLKRWTGSLSQDDLPLFHDFVEATLPALRGPFLAQHSPKQVLSILETAFRFARSRPPGQLKVTIQPASKGLIVMSCVDDQPFIVDTIRLFLRSGESDYWGGFNLVYHAVRDSDGELVAVGDKDGEQESLVVLEADRGKVLDDREHATEALRTNLTLARALVRDFRLMTRTIERVVDRFEVLAERRPDQAELARESAAFLKWLLRENFVFMGVEYNNEAMGIQGIPGRFHNTPEGDWPEPHPPGTVQVRKSHQESPVHRAGRIDEILVRHEDTELYIRGMFTYRAVTQPSRNVPILRGVLANILGHRQSAPGSYRYKGIANVFDSLPTEFLFTADPSAIGNMVDLVLEAEQQQEVGATVMMIGQASAFCLVAMPKSQYNDDLRQGVEHTIVSALNATYSDHGLFVGRYDTVLLHYYLTGVRPLDKDGGDALAAQIRSMATPWLARLWTALAARFGEERADRLIDTYGRAFPDLWMHTNSAERAVRDIEMLEALTGKQNVLVDIYDDERTNPSIRLYEAEELFLTSILPKLDNFGLVVIESYATKVDSRGGKLHMDTFHVVPPAGVSTQEFKDRSPLLRGALEAVFSGGVDDDAINRLVLSSGLDWREVNIIRAYTRYLRQLQVKLSGARITEILLANPIMCHTLVDLFHARFDPDLEGDRKQEMARADQKVKDELRLIMAHDESLLFSSLSSLIRATLRTNFYRSDRHFHYLSFKVDGGRLKALGANPPMFEVFVHHRDVEGVHIRFGKVARGGIRWSNRDDFRTEVMGLATTQLVKNVVIVPTGAKGGFYLKNASQDPATRRKEADHHYKTFIRGLLDLADNNVDGKTVPPPRVVCHDPPDPYLVVAADKGTAHLSDAANSVSAEYGFWLGDAFASGGSVGFDHKKVGITARGAWVLVRRHFAERGINPYKESFTCVGIGDMGGDVFGNGLLETPHAKLEAAFNHLHVFLDPAPDPKASYEERKRLFESQEGWDGYDKALLSEGGGVFERRAKSIPLSPQAQEMLGLEQDEAEPELVIKRILQMDVDLIWNGGIGTYVKASYESQADADDRANSAVRIDAPMLRGRIIGEGGNLGMTHRARIEAGLCGVSLNTDAIDNSGGVDLSDHEVNLKILLAEVVRKKGLSRNERDELLMEITEEVAQLVLKNNDAHGRQLSRDQIRSRTDIFQFGRAIAFVEEFFGRSRDTMNLPAHQELEQRASEGLGLTRPELAVLSAWVKMYVARELNAGEPKKIPGYKEMLLSYFPKKIQARYAKEIQAHMLADEIVVTTVTTRIIADAGAAFFPMMVETTGASVFEIASAYLHAQGLAKTKVVRATLENLRSKVPLPELYRAWVEVDDGVRQVARYWLSTRGRIPKDSELKEMSKAIEEVFALEDKGPRATESLFQALEQGDVTKKVQRQVAKARYMNTALMVWAESRNVDEPLDRVVQRHVAIARGSRLQTILDDLGSRPASGEWDPIALKILQARFHQLLRLLVAQCPCPDEFEDVEALRAELEAGPLADVRQHVDRLTADDERPSVATLLVLEERVAGAISRIS